MDGYIPQAAIPQQPYQGHSRQRTTDPPRRREYQPARVLQGPHALQDRDRRIGQRDAMLGPALHSLGRDAPLPRLEVDFAPGRAPGLAAPAGRQDQETETGLSPPTTPRKPRPFPGPGPRPHRAAPGSAWPGL